MRNPTALDAMARWLVLTLAGVGLFALIPGSSFAAPGFSSTRWFLTLHPVQVVALVMMALAWVLFVVHLALLAGPWLRDPLSVTLAVLAVASVGAAVAAFSWGPTESVVGTFVASVALHIGLCARIDWFRRHGRAVLATPGPVGPGPGALRPRKRRAATAL